MNEGSHRGGLGGSHVSEEVTRAAWDSEATPLLCVALPSSPPSGPPGHTLEWPPSPREPFIKEAQVYKQKKPRREERPEAPGAGSLLMY